MQKDELEYAFFSVECRLQQQGMSTSPDLLLTAFHIILAAIFKATCVSFELRL